MNDDPASFAAYGVYRQVGEAARIGMRCGDSVVDLAALAARGAFDRLDANVRAIVTAPNLDPFLASDHRRWPELHAGIYEIARDIAADGGPLCAQIDAVEMVRPFTVADYVDFYASIEHATNVGRIFRPTEEPLTPNYRSMPIGYHGRAGTVDIANATLARPRGQYLAPGAVTPTFGPTRKLDFEVELGFVTGATPASLSVDAADDYVFGVMLLVDWSARDIQAWEYRPLGPFLGKSFATTISPWIVPFPLLADRLRPARDQEPPPLEHLHARKPRALDLDIEVSLASATMRERGVAPITIVQTNSRDLYWTFAQKLAHVTSNGTALRPGDLFGTGTISRAEAQSVGSLLERTNDGRTPLMLPTHETRGYLHDGDRITFASPQLGTIAVTVARS